MKIAGISQLKNFCFTSSLTKKDRAYKSALCSGLKDNYGINASVENLDPIVAPDELKNLLKKFSKTDYETGCNPSLNLPPVDTFENVANRTHRVNLHAHTNKTNKKMSTEDFLAQSLKYADKAAEVRQNDEIPAYTSAITDHNNIEGVKQAIAAIAKEPDKYKNYKFVPGCEFRLKDTEHNLKHPSYEVVGLCFNPFDEELNSSLKEYNSTEIIQKIKETGGIVSYAHPLRFCQNQEVDDEFIQYLVDIGVDGIESNYQYFFNKPHDITEGVEKIDKLAKKYDLYETGGTDTHGNNIFHDRAEPILDVLV